MKSTYGGAEPRLTSGDEAATRRALNIRKSVERSLVSRSFPPLNNVVVAFYILGLVIRLSLTFIIQMPVRMTDSRLAFGWVRKDGLPRFTVGACDDKVPLEGFAFR